VRGGGAGRTGKTPPRPDGAGTPLHTGRLKAMLAASRIGAIVVPPVPAFHSKPASLRDMGGSAPPSPAPVANLTRNFRETSVDDDSDGYPIITLSIPPAMNLSISG